VARVEPPPDLAAVPTFQNHFSGHAAAYARARPTYPRALFAQLAALAPATERAWDAGTGSGQAAVGLAAHFAAVLATDPSAEQVARARRHRRVAYAVALAESSGLAAASCDLVTAAQALHWFDVPRFWEEARRVLRPRGVVAVWCYERLRAAPAVQAVVDALYEDVAAHWPPERALVERGYADLSFPFAALPFVPPPMTAEWTRAALLDYLRTWSAVRRAAAARGVDPVDAIVDRLDVAWGDVVRRTITWPLAVRVGRV
jgi:SAM-dependent methyltransferase